MFISMNVKHRRFIKISRSKGEMSQYLLKIIDIDILLGVTPSFALQKL